MSIWEWHTKWNFLIQCNTKLPVISTYLDIKPIGFCIQTTKLWRRQEGRTSLQLSFREKSERECERELLLLSSLLSTRIFYRRLHMKLMLHYFYEGVVLYISLSRAARLLLSIILFIICKVIRDRVGTPLWSWCELILWTQSEVNN